VEQITFKQNTTMRLTTTKQYDNLNRLRVIPSVPSGSSAVSFQYQYNDANQRTRNTEANGDYWSYQYDTLGQVSSGKKYTSGGSPISGRQFEYDFDDIANRDYTVADGTTTDYTANLLNQYTTRVTGGTTETFQHDEDGNLQSDSLWVYTWDGENRIVNMQSQASVPDASKRKLQFEYDYLGRRIGKKVYLWSGGGYSPTPSVYLKFVYDDWNLLAELDANSNLVRSYMWGLDLSGSEQGAGGVGGLLLFIDHSSPATRHFVAYDGNGNVMALVNAADGTVSAQYEYSPFGETLSLSGSVASANPFRFSTKYMDSESGFLYYGYRYYNPSTGNWLSRELLGELGGANLYAFARNNPIGLIDLLGFLVTSVTWTNAATLDPDWTLATTQSYISPDKIVKEPCPCGKKITSVSIKVKTVVTILSGHYWREKVGAHELTIGQHENQHVKIDQRTGQTIEDTLKKLIGKCRNTECMGATDNYIAAVINYYNEERNYKNARFDVFDYAEGYRKEERRKDASYFESGMKTNQKLMEDAAKKINEACVQ
jgi:RHS repeat-associated protein